MNKKHHLIIFFTISIIGFTTGVYLKFFKTYQNDIQITVKNIDGESTQKQLRLNENIEFLQELDKTFTSHRIDRTEKDKLPQALKRLKIINTISIASMIISIFLFLWSLRKLLIQNKHKKLAV